MNRKLLICLLAVVGAPILLSGCAGITIGAPTASAFPSDAASSPESSTPALPTVAPGTVGIILPDSADGTRWDAAGQKILSDAFAAAGVPVSIQNANGDTAAFVSFAQDMMNQGITVLVVVSPDDATGAEAIAAANGLGAVAIDYDRLTLNGGAQYFVGIKGGKPGDSVAPGTAKAEAEALASIARALIGEDPTQADGLTVDTVPDTEAGYDVPALLVAP